jgi:AcrR family transcriptional regulator
MATKTKSTAKRKQTKVTADQIIDAYIQYVLEEGKEPQTPYILTQKLGVSETEFYKNFGSLHGLQKSIWKAFVSRPIETCRKDENFDQFSAREKLLAFYFTFAEYLTEYRTFALWSLKPPKRPEVEPSVLSHAKKEFLSFAQEVVGAGLDSGEIIDRPLVGSRYKEALWVQFMFILQYWKKDDSQGFQKTDAAIEKSVNLSFELMGKSALDSMIDFGKFLIQNR